MSNKDKSINWSYWEKTEFFDEVDLLIVGGGIVGVSLAIRAKELLPAWKIRILERGSLPLGASTRNAGFACFGSMTELIDDYDNHTEEEVFQIVEKRWRGLQRLRSRVGDAGLDFQFNGAYELFYEKDESSYQDCLQHIETFNSILREIVGAKVVFSVKDQKIQAFGFSGVQHLIYNNAEGQLNPGKMMKALWQIAQHIGVEIVTSIEVESIVSASNHAIVKTRPGINFKARKVVLATNGFTQKLFPNLNVLPARNQVLITHPIDDLPFEGCFHFDKGYYYFRNVGERILFGGGRNLDETGEQTAEFGQTELIQKTLIQYLDTVILPDRTYEIDQWWSGILGVGNQKRPIIKKVEDHIYAAVRLGGMGVAIGTLVGEEAADLILNS